MIVWWFVHDFLVMFSWFVSWFFHDLNVGTRSQPTPNLLCFVLIYLRFFVDFLLIFWVARGEAPQRGGEAAELAGKAVSFLPRISHIFRIFLLTIFRRFFIDFLSSEGRSPEARRRSHAEVAGKAVSFLLRIPYIFQNFPLLSFYSPRFPFLLLQVYKISKNHGKM